MFNISFLFGISNSKSWQIFGSLFNTCPLMTLKKELEPKLYDRNVILRNKILLGKPGFKEPQIIILSNNFSLKKTSFQSFRSSIAPLENACCSHICIIKVFELLLIFIKNDYIFGVIRKIT